MKKISLILTVIFALSVIFVGCKKDNDLIKADIMPENFKVDIPNSISNSTLKSNKDGTLQGNDIYEHLSNFINIGEGAADIVQDIIRAIRKYDLDRAMTFSYEGEDDGRTKNVVIVENAEFEGKVWEYQLTTTDAESETNADGGKALQIFWNNSPVDGIAILKPFNIDRNYNDEWNNENTMYRIDYSEAGTDYEQKMLVYISDLTLPDPTISDNRFAMGSMKMFAGKKGNIVDVYGNSNHPNATFFDDNTVGFNWAFVASGDNSVDRAVAEVGLPPSNLDESSRAVLLETYSIYNVFYNELTEMGYQEPDIQDYLFNAQAPGYFNGSGFVSAGTSPSSAYDVAEASMNLLVPYNPKLISSLTISFK